MKSFVVIFGRIAIVYALRAEGPEAAVELAGHTDGAREPWDVGGHVAFAFDGQALQRFELLATSSTYFRVDSDPGPIPATAARLLLSQWGLK